MTVHQYLSTSCLHAQLAEQGSDSIYDPHHASALHAYCQGETGAVGAKLPAQCKFCTAQCTCECHRGEVDGDSGPGPVE